ncbi:galactose mutarotase-like domain-containing protein [Flammula alnicola]|nr:galactose mutarotase-like domain-containing protein [Flammula alnicola]
MVFFQSSSLLILTAISCFVLPGSAFAQRGNAVAPDTSIRASFIPFGATTTNFWVKDKKGVFRDIILGFDNHTLYQSDAEGHPYFGPVVGRYANRIRNGTFTIPISKDASGPNKFFVPRNENNFDSLHGGSDGFDRRVWETTKVSSNSVTFMLVDANGMEGFPATVITTVTYTLQPKSTWKISMNAVASAETPIMLSGHHYWNLEAYQESSDLVGHHAQFEASKFVATDGHLIPTGQLLDVGDTPMDFEKQNPLVDEEKAAFSMWSVNSGIKLDIFTNQPALQVYTCNGIFNVSLPIPRKSSQGGPGNVYTDHSCVVIEMKVAYNWEASYVFSTI